MILVQATTAALIVFSMLQSTRGVLASLCAFGGAVWLVS